MKGMDLARSVENLKGFSTQWITGRMKNVYTTCSQLEKKKLTKDLLKKIALNTWKLKAQQKCARTKENKDDQIL